jgi:hypothetical protein
MRAILLLMTVCLSLIATGANAQPKVYVRSDGQFVANGNEYARGFWIPTINGAEDVFAGNPEALEQYQEHLKWGRWFGYFNWGAIGAFAVYAAASGDDYEGGTGLLVFGVPWVTGLFIGAKSNRHLLRAINMANGVPAKQALTNPYQYNSKSLNVPLLAWSF